MSERISTVEAILAIVTTHPQRVQSGRGAPVFVVSDEEELERVSLLLSRVMMGMAHEIGEGTMIIVKH